MKTELTRSERRDLNEKITLSQDKMLSSSITHYVNGLMSRTLSDLESVENIVDEFEAVASEFQRAAKMVKEYTEV